MASLHGLLLLMALVVRCSFAVSCSGAEYPTCAACADTEARCDTSCTWRDAACICEWCPIANQMGFAASADFCQHNVGVLKAATDGLFVDGNFIFAAQDGDTRKLVLTNEAGTLMRIGMLNVAIETWRDVSTWEITPAVYFVKNFKRRRRWEGEQPQPVATPKLDMPEAYAGTGIPALVILCGPFEPTNLIDANRAHFPQGTEFRYFNYKAMTDEVRETEKLLEESGAWKGSGLLAAFLALRAVAYRSDLFRYAALWRLGGYYLDGKMVAHRPISEFTGKWLSMCHDPRIGNDYTPSMYSINGYRFVRIQYDAAEVWRDFIPCWSGMLASPPRAPVLVTIMRHLVTTINGRIYPYHTGPHSWQFLTGPGALGVATAGYSTPGSAVTHEGGAVAYFHGEHEFARLYDCSSLFTQDATVHSSMKECTTCNDYGTVYFNKAVYCDAPYPAGASFYDPCSDGLTWGATFTPTETQPPSPDDVSTVPAAATSNRDESNLNNNDEGNGNEGNLGEGYLMMASTSAVTTTTAATATSATTTKATQTSAANVTHATSSLAPAFLGTLAPDALWAKSIADLAGFAKCSAVLLGLFGSCGLCCACCLCMVKRLRSTAKPYSAVATGEGAVAATSARAQPDSVDPSIVGSLAPQPDGVFL